MWISLTILKINLKSYPSITDPYIELDSYKVQSIGLTCDYQISRLIAEIKINYDVPYPSASITAPDIYSLKCAQGSLQVSASFQESLAVYTWRAESEPANPDLLSFIESQNSSFYEIPKSLLSESSVKIYLETRYKGLETSAKSSQVVEISGQESLSVTTNYGSYVEVKQSQELLIFAIVTEFCESSQGLSYKWSSEMVDLTGIGPLDSRPDSLLIPKNKLLAGNQYLLQVRVSQDKAVGVAACLVVVKASDLVIRLSRSSGSIAKTADFEVDCTVQDPDDENAVIEKQWYCVEENGECKDSSGSTLTLTQSKCLLKIPKEKLRSRATYFLTVRAQTSKKSTLARIQVNVDPKVEGVAQVSFPSIKINPFYVNNLIPKIEYLGNLEFEWSVSGGDFDSSEISLYNSFIGFPEYSLKQGVTYQLELKIISDQFKNPLMAYGTVISNLGPVCNGLLASKQSIDWKLLADGCVDGDNEDYPLNFQFGYHAEDEYKWVSELTALSSYQSSFHSSIQKLCVRVFDTIGTWNIYCTAIKSAQRYLKDYLMEVINQVKNPSNVPNVIIQYCLYDLDYPTFNFIYSAFYSYFSSFYPHYSNLDLFIDCLSSILKQNSFLSNDLLNNATQLAISVVSKYEVRLFTEESIKIIEIFSQIADKVNSSLIFDLFSLIGEKWVIDTIPNIELQYFSSIPMLKMRKISQAYVGYRGGSEKLKIEYPVSSSLNMTNVYDTLVLLVTDKKGYHLHFLIKSSGVYEDYNLGMKEIEKYFDRFENGITFYVENSNGFTDAKCSKDGVEEDCMIEKVNKTHIVMNLFGDGSYYVEEGESGCGLNKVPITVSALILILTATIVVYLFLRDRKRKLNENANLRFVDYFSTTSVFRPKSNPHRIIAIMRVSSKVMLIFALLGSNYIPDLGSALSSVSNYLNFIHFGKGIVSLAIVQFINVVMIVFVSLKKNSPSAGFIELVIYFACSALSFCSIILICLMTCIKDVNSWLIGLAIFSLVELFMVEPLWALLIVLVCKKDRQKTSKVTQLPAQKSSMYDGFNLNETDNFSPRVLVSSITRSSIDRSIQKKF